MLLTEAYEEMASNEPIASKVPGGVLVGSQIRELAIVAENACESCYKSASYDLRLGLEYLRPKRRNESTSHLFDGESLSIPPFSSIIVSTHEILSIPNNVIGKFNLKIKMALRGLFVQMGTQVEPGYNGRLFALLQNISDEEVQLKAASEDKTIFTIEFYFTSLSVPDGQVDKRVYNTLRELLSATYFVKGTINNLTTELKSQVEQQSNSYFLYQR